jgi:hypothetical protein
MGKTKKSKLQRKMLEVTGPFRQFISMTCHKSVKRNNAKEKPKSNPGVIAQKLGLKEDPQDKS